MKAPLDRLIELMLEAEGGAKYHWNAGEAGPTKYGIYGPANGLAPEAVKALTLAQAVAIYKRKYVTPDVLQALAQGDFIEASLLFNINVNLGVKGKQRVQKEAALRGESLSEALVRYYEKRPNAKLYFTGWCVRAVRNYEMGRTLVKEFA